MLHDRSCYGSRNPLGQSTCACSWHFVREADRFLPVPPKRQVASRRTSTTEEEGGEPRRGLLTVGQHPRHAYQRQQQQQQQQRWQRSKQQDHSKPVQNQQPQQQHHPQGVVAKGQGGSSGVDDVSTFRGEYTMLYTHMFYQPDLLSRFMPPYALQRRITILRSPLDVLKSAQKVRNIK